eukprot:11838542-Karenia_brevis.AAC.1
MARGNIIIIIRLHRRRHDNLKLHHPSLASSWSFQRRANECPHRHVNEKYKIKAVQEIDMVIITWSHHVLCVPRAKHVAFQQR